MKTKTLLALLILSVILTNNIHSQGWVIQPSGTTSALRQIVFYNAQTGWTVGDGGRILKSTNGGASWSTQSSGTTQDLYSVAFKDSVTLLACGNGGVILKTTNGGTSWTSQNSGTTNKLKSMFHLGGDYFYCCGENGTLLLTYYGGTPWITLNSNTTQHLNCFYFEDSTSGWVFGNNGTVRRNVGSQPWGIIPFPTTENLSAASGSTTSSGAFCTNIGNIYAARNYTAINTGVNTPLNSVAAKGYTYFTIPVKTWCVGDNGVIRYSSDTGHTWTGQNISASINITSIYMLDTLRGWICGTNGLISNTTTGGVIGIKPISTEIPKEFNLSQNYPNPFNPSTKIKFDIPGSSVAQTFLSVYDILGSEVSTLVNPADAGLKPGSYEVEWSAAGGASKYSSGVYFYKLYVGDLSTGTRQTGRQGRIL